MDKAESLLNLARNLATLCKSYASVAEVCRRMNINRQQFNKYLAGQHLPTARARAAMSAFFMIEEDDLFRNPSAFNAVMEGPRVDLSWLMRSSDQFRQFLPLIAGSGAAMRPYLGLYYRYHNSSIHEGRVLRSLMYVYEANGLCQYVAIERFPNGDGSKRTECIFKYHGFGVMAGERIFLIDFETLQRNELTFSIFLPKHRNALQKLYGVLTGIAATPFRVPFSNRVVLDFQGAGPIRKSHLRMATTLSGDAAEIPDDIRRFLGQGTLLIL